MRRCDHLKVPFDAYVKFKNLGVFFHAVLTGTVLTARDRATRCVHAKSSNEGTLRLRSLKTTCGAGFC